MPLETSCDQNKLPELMPDPETTPLSPVREDPAAETGGICRGVDVISAHLGALPSGPGVYRMLNADGDALYVGKARSLKKRVSTYTQLFRLPVRLQRMVSETAAMEFVTTHTEVEALLLESNLIKRLKPRYNVLLRDDKSFPDILIRRDHAFAQIVKHRGARTLPGEYFGPFASAGAVNRTITALQRAFLLRNCSDSVFNARTRPCLQYQIKRCSAPCVGLIGESDYADLVAQAEEFLTGKSRDVQDRLGRDMETASAALEFETAAAIRDRIRALSMIQSHQDINVEGVEEADVVALHGEGGQVCIQVFFFRGGSNYGNRAYFPSHDKAMDSGGILAAFLGQFYEGRMPPREVLVSETPREGALIAEALSVRAGRKVSVRRPERGGRRKLVDHAAANARAALARRLAESTSNRKVLEQLGDLLGLEAAPGRIEVYDNSHIQGRNPVGAMIVAGPEGLMKNAYRKFNIKTAGVDGQTSGGDDFAMMREVLGRRFTRALKEDPDRGESWPDLVVIDGGKGQLSSAQTTLAELGIEDVPLVAIAKGPDRNAGREAFHMEGRPSFTLEPRDPVLYYLQRLRDEAHRFAIGTHRAKRAKDLARSPLDEIQGIGAKRKKALLLRFGSAKAVARAGLTDLETVDGISKSVARKIYDYFHGEG